MILNWTRKSLFYIKKTLSFSISRYIYVYLLQTAFSTQYTTKAYSSKRIFSRFTSSKSFFLLLSSHHFSSPPNITFFCRIKKNLIYYTCNFFLHSYSISFPPPTLKEIEHCYYHGTVKGKKKMQNIKFRFIYKSLTLFP